MKVKIRPARKSGTSFVVSLTGFVEEGENYKIEKKDDKTITLTKVE